MPRYARERDPVRGALPRLAHREFALNEKRLDERAGLRHAEVLISSVKQSVADLAATVTLVSAAFGVNPLRPRWLLIPLVLTSPATQPVCR